MRRFIFPFIFIAFVLISTESALKNVRVEKNRLQVKLDQLQLEKEKALATQKVLLKQMNSQSDPAWIELVLKRELGVIPEGETKVLFTPS